MEWPWQYSFPPFFTLQPHKDTRDKQIEAWRHLVLNYCQVRVHSSFVKLKVKVQVNLW